MGVQEVCELDERVGAPIGSLNGLLQEVLNLGEHFFDILARLINEPKQAGQLEEVG